MASYCKYCGERITWAKTGKGKMMPMDKKPTDDGEWALDFDGTTSPPRAHRAEPGTALRYTPHWATCTHSKEARENARRRKDVDG